MTQNNPKRAASKAIKVLVLGACLVALALLVGFGMLVYSFAQPSACQDAARKACATAGENLSKGLAEFDQVVVMIRRKDSNLKDSDLKDRASAFYTVCAELDYLYVYNKSLPLFDEALALNEQAGNFREAASLAIYKAEELHKCGRGAESLAAAQQSMALFGKLPDQDRVAGHELSSYVTVLQAQIDRGDLAASEKALHHGEELLALCDDSSSYCVLRLNMERARLLLLQKRLAESEKQFAELMKAADAAGGACRYTQEEFLLDYVKSLKIAGYDARADYYNNKLDRALDFTGSAWKSFYDYR